LIIGVVALIVIGPKDLPEMFRTLGRFTAKLRSMSRDFQRAMEAAAKDTGVNDIAKDVKNMASPKNMGLDAVRNAADRFEKWDPLKPTPAPKPTPAVGPGSAATTAAPAPAPAAPMGPATAALAEAKAKERAAALAGVENRIAPPSMTLPAAAAPAVAVSAPAKVDEAAPKVKKPKVAKAEAAPAKPAKAKAAPAAPSKAELASKPRKQRKATPEGDDA
jgi:sec-independent protein translocase protein TatB